MMQDGSKYKCLMQGDILGPDVGNYEVFDIASLGVSVRIYEISISDMILFEKKYTSEGSDKLNLSGGSSVLDLIKATVKDSSGAKVFDDTIGNNTLQSLPASEANKMFRVAFRLSWKTADDKKKTDDGTGVTVP